LRNGGIAPQILTSTLDGGEWSASRYRHFAPGEKAPDTRWVGAWMDPRNGLERCGEEKDPTPAGNRTPAVQPVAILTDSRGEYRRF
jgi:hypothetical protein